MRTFELKSGTTVTVTDSQITIERTDSKSAAKALFAGRTTGKMVIKLSSLSGVVFSADYLIICGSGLPCPNDFKISSVNDIKQHPNCIVGKPEELEELYNCIASLI